MAAYNPYNSWQYRNQTYDEDSDSDTGSDDEYDEEEEYSDEEEEYDDEDEEYGEEEEECDEEEYDEDGEEEEEEEECEEEEEEDLIVTVVLEKHLPETWSEMDEYPDVELVTLDRYSPEFQNVESKIRSTLNIYIHRIERLQNPYLWGSYLLMKGEYKKVLKKSLSEMELFHATGQSNVQSIVENNFDWRRVGRSRYGKGVSFSPYADYANKYCNKKIGNQRALILTRVLVGKCHEGNYKTTVPSDGHDTTTGNGGRVYVKYGDNEYYPEYVAYYECYN